MSNEKRYPVHHTDHDNFPDVGAVYVTKAEFDAMKSERDALKLLVDEKQHIIDDLADKVIQLDAANAKQFASLIEQGKEIAELKLKLSEAGAA